LRHTSILILALIFAVGCKRVETEPKSKPALKLTGRVVDAANLLAPETEARLTAKLEAAEKAYGPQMVVATTPSLGGREIEAYSIDLARAWAIGDKKRNDGLVLLIAPTERMVRIEVGYGLEGSFSDAFAKSILDHNILPLFKGGQFDAGVEAGVDRIIAKMKAVPTLPANDNIVPVTKDKAA
jgi:uncharacterized protein